MLDAFCDSLSDNAVVVEAGAYHGEDTVRLAERVGFVHAFEPVSRAEARDATRHLANVHIWPGALGDRVGGSPMWVSGGGHSAASSLLPPKEHCRVLPAITFDRGMVVPVTTLRRWAKQNNVTVDGLWLDLQGMELRVLQAAGPVLGTVRSIVLEVSRVEMYEGCPLAPEVGEWLERQGFSIFAEEEQGAEQANWLVTRG